MNNTEIPPIADLIPHEGPMVLVDSITHWDDQTILCQSQSHLQTENPLRDNGVLSVFAGVEYAAQAMAAHARLISPRAGGAPRKGFLAVASKLEASVDTLDTIDAPLSISAQMLAHNSDSSLYSFSIEAADTTLITGQLTALMVSETQPQT